MISACFLAVSPVSASPVEVRHKEGIVHGFLVLSTLEGKTIILGVIDLSDPAVETPEVVVERVRRALPYVPASRLVLAPDCGMKYITREAANGKMAALAAAAAALRTELA